MASEISVPVSPDPSTKSNQPGPSRWKRTLIISVAGLLLGLLLVVLLIPTFLSTGTGIGIITGQVNQRIQGTLIINKLSLSWFSGQRVEGLAIRDAAGQQDVLTVKQVDVPGVSLWNLLTGSKAFGSIRIEEPVLRVVQDASGTTNLQSLFKSSSNEAGAPSTELPKGLSFQLQANQGKIIAQTVQGTSQVNDLNITVDMPDTQTLSMSMQGQLQQADASGAVQMQAKVADLTDNTGQLQLAQAQADITVEWTNMPVSLLDVLSGQPGKFTSLLGPSMTGKITSKGKLADLDAQLSAQSEHASVNLQAHQKGENQQTNLIIAPGSKIQLTLTPEAFEAWSRSKTGTQDGSPFKLMSALPVEVVLEDISLPQKDGQLHWPAARGKAHVTAGDAVLDMGGDIGRITLHDTHGLMEFAGFPTVQAVMQLRSEAQTRGQTGRVAVNITLHDWLNLQGQINTDKLSGKVEVGITDWPVALMDLFAKSDGLMVQALGTTLSSTLNADLQFAADTGKPIGQVNLQLSSNHLRGTLHGSMTDRGLVLTEGQKLTWRITPELVSKLLKGSTTQLAEPVTTELTFSQMQIPLQGNLLTGSKASASMQLSPILLRKLAGLESLRLDDTRFTLAFDGEKPGLNAEFNARFPHPGGSTPIDIKANITDFITPQGTLAPAQSRGQITLLVDRIPTPLFDSLVQVPNLGKSALGDWLQIQASATLLPDTTVIATMPIIDYTLQAQADLLTAKAKGRASGKDISLETVERLRWVVQPALVEALRQSKPDIAKLLQGRGLIQPATITLDALRISLPKQASGGLMSEARLAGKVGIDRLMLSGDPRLAGVEILDVTLDVADTTLAKGVDAKLTADVRHQKQTGKILANIQLRDLISSTPGGPVFKIPARLDNVPVSLIDQFMNQPGKYTALLGAKVDRIEVIDLSNTQADRTDYGFNLLVQSPDLYAAIKGHFKPGAEAAVEDGGIIRLTLAPQRWGQLQQHWLGGKGDANQLALLEPFNLELALRQMQLHFAAPNPNGTNSNEGASKGFALDGQRSVVSMAMVASPMHWQLPGKQMDVMVSELKLDLAGSNLASEQTVHLSSKYQVQGTNAARAQASKSTGQVQSVTAIGSLLDNTGQMNVGKANWKTNSKMTELPVILLDELMGQQGKLVSALGTTLNAQLEAHNQVGQGGPVQLKIQSPNLSTNLSGQLDKDMTLTLREVAQINFTVTRDLAQQYLASANYLLKDAQSSNGPVKLILSPNGFSLPLRNFKQSLDKLTMQGRLELGTMRIRRGPGGELVGLLKLAGARIQDREEFDAVFSPMSIVIKDGVVTCSDLWMDTGDLRIGSQSKVYLTGKSTTPWGEVLLAIPGDTVLVVPGTRGKIDPRSIYTIGTVGPLGTLKPDLASLVTRIVAPVAGRSIGGDAGTAVELGAAIFGVLQDRQKAKQDHAQAAWFAGATWPNRPQVTLPVDASQTTPTTPSQTDQSGQPAKPVTTQPFTQPPATQQPDTQKEPVSPEEQLLRGLLRGLGSKKQQDEKR